MDYEKKYNEALERAKKILCNLGEGDGSIRDIETIFPELAESEDERIRKDLIGGLMWQRDNLKSEGPHDNSLILPGFCLTVGEHLAYLEKQKEQKPAEWSEEDTEMYINVASSLRGYACGLENEEHKKHIKKGLDWLETRFNSLRPSWKPSEEQMAALLNAEGYLRAGDQYDSARIIARLYEQLKRIKED